MEEIEKLLTEQEAADIARTTVYTIRYWRQTGRLGFIKPGKHPLIPVSVLKKFLLGNESATMPPARGNGKGA